MWTATKTRIDKNFRNEASVSVLYSNGVDSLEEAIVTVNPSSIDQMIKNRTLQFQAVDDYVANAELGEVVIEEPVIQKIPVPEMMVNQAPTYEDKRNALYVVKQDFDLGLATQAELDNALKEALAAKI